MKITRIEQVVSWRLCVGCGACAYICRKGHIELRDIPTQGIRPVIHSGDCGTCTDCLDACPGLLAPDVQMALQTLKFTGINEKCWGPVIEVWEGYASDPEVRHKGSSGGATTALALYCLEKKGLYGALHIGSDKEEPLKNKIYMSCSRPEVISRTGSRYSPASPCAGLERIESAPARCVFIGKGCDIAGLRKACRIRPDLQKNNGLAIGIFCAGTPSGRGLSELLNKMQVNPDAVREIRYRGMGWPGSFTVDVNDNERTSHSIPYMEAWGFLQKYRPYRCYLCPDGTAALADISCGDPWHRKAREGDPGHSLVIVRTEKGRKILHEAMDTGYLSLKPASMQTLNDSQVGLLQRVKEIWGRLLTMKLFGLPIPQYPGFFLFEQWLTATANQKARSIVGTARRIVQRKYYRPFTTGQP